MSTLFSQRLLDQGKRLLVDARSVLGASNDLHLRELALRLPDTDDTPLKVVATGAYNAAKSTLLKALTGDDIYIDPELLGTYANQNRLTARFEKLARLPRVDRPSKPERTHRYRRRLSDLEIESLITAGSDGSSVYGLGDKFGINRKTVAEILKRHGVAMRYRQLSDGDKAEARRLRSAGWTYARLAELFDVHQASMWNMLDRGRR